MSNVSRLRHGYEQAANKLIEQATAAGHWEGELSSSPLSTATAVAALELVRRKRSDQSTTFENLIHGGLKWLADHQNADGGWGDTVLSHSNISTTTLAFASFHLIGSSASPSYDVVKGRAKAYMDQHGGFDAIRKRYGKDHTFSVPILTMCAIAGLIPWHELSPLPFELGCLPHSFYQWIRLPVVSYALPALIAIGQVRHHIAPSRNPLIRLIRQLSVQPTLRRLTEIQPESGGFLEATPLTSFVTMSLAAMDQHDHPVTQRAVDFLIASVRGDGSWPIDTNLATWVTTLSVNALFPHSMPQNQRESIVSWLLGQQNRVVHKYTNAAPGGWAWTNLTGGVPDADDTPGAILALIKLNSASAEVCRATTDGVRWLLDLQNRDGGWPTFCRGWGALPFDRSTPDLTAHTLRALRAWLDAYGPGGSQSHHGDQTFIHRIHRAVETGFEFLMKTQRPDGTWLPLWFGNQDAVDDENPVYGVGRALLAYRAWNRTQDPACQSAMAWLASVQNTDGGWGGAAKIPSSVEETALAADALLGNSEYLEESRRAIDWLLDRVQSEEFVKPAPIGLYFAKLWYFEQLYPMIFTVSALARAVRTIEPSNSVDQLVQTARNIG